MPLHKRLITGLFRYRNWCLGVTLLLTIPLIAVSQQLKFDQSIESLYSLDNPYLKDFRESRLWFGGDEILMLVWKQPGLRAPADSYNQVTNKGLEEIQKYEEQVRRIPGVIPESVQSLAGMLIPEDAGLAMRVILRIKANRDRLIDFAESFLIGKDRETVAILLKLKPESETNVSRELSYRELRKFAEQHPYNAHVVGEPIQVHEMFVYVEEDGAVLGYTTLVIVIIVLLILFKSPRWVVLPVFVVQIAIFWTRGILVLTDISLSMVSSILNSLLIIIGVATMTHLIVHYREYRTENSPKDALKLTFFHLAKPVFWTTVTTALGFLSLLSSSISPVRSFGGMVAGGTVLVVLSIYFVVPGVILLGKGADPKPNPGQSQLVMFMSAAARFVSKYPRYILCTLLTIMGICGYGMTLMKVETDFSKNFRDTSAIVKALDFVENNLGGAGNWEINFEAPNPLTSEFIERVDRVTEKLRNMQVEGTEISPITKIVTISDGLNFIPKLPLLPRDPEGKLNLVNNFQPEFEATLYARKYERMRIIIRGWERLPSDVKIRTIEKSISIAREELEDVRATGLYVLLSYLIESLLEDQIISFVIAASTIFLIMSIAFKNPLIGLISLLPNVFPLMILLGIMGWTGMLVNIGTAMIASVSLGLTIDSSIHYLNAYTNMRRAGYSHLQSVENAHGRVGVALLLANLALVLGFLVLVLSNFIPLVVFGVLVSLAMVGGLIGNLVLLPAALSLFPARWLGCSQVPDRDVDNYEKL